VTYEVRLNANYAFGLLTQAAQVSDTTLTSTDFGTRLPSALSTTTYVPITLHDPSAGIYEVAWANSHTAGASTATVLRGRENTTSLTWPAGTMWTVAPTLRDGVLPVANRAALPIDPHVGLECLVQDEQVKVERFLASWGPPAAHLRQTTAQTLVNGTWTTVTFGAEDYDNAGGHDPASNTSRYTIKQAGRYQLAGGFSVATNAAGGRAAVWYRNGASFPSVMVDLPPVQLGYTIVPARTVQVQCALNDYIELAVYQDSGASLATLVTPVEAQSHMSVLYLGG
jgi:hypothetical protein